MTPLWVCKAHRRGKMDDIDKIRDYLHKLIDKASLDRLRIVLAFIREVIK